MILYSYDYKKKKNHYCDNVTVLRVVYLNVFVLKNYRFFFFLHSRNVVRFACTTQQSLKRNVDDFDD